MATATIHADRTAHDRADIDTKIAIAKMIAAVESGDVRTLDALWLEAGEIRHCES